MSNSNNKMCIKDRWSSEGD